VFYTQTKSLNSKRIFILYSKVLNKQQNKQKVIKIQTIEQIEQEVKGQIKQDIENLNKATNKKEFLDTFLDEDIRKLREVRAVIIQTPEDILLEAEHLDNLERDNSNYLDYPVIDGKVMDEFAQADIENDDKGVDYDND